MSIQESMVTDEDTGFPEVAVNVRVVNQTWVIHKSSIAL